MAKYLLLGGGYTLSILAGKLRAGDFVITATSSEKAEDFRRKGWTAERLDSKDPLALKKLSKDYPDITHVVDSIPPLTDCEDKLTGIRNVCNAFSPAKLKRIIYLSTTGVYGKQDGSWIDEGSETSPNNEKSLARLDSEQFYRQSGISCTVLRIAAIYGKGRGIGLALKNGRFPVIEGHDRWSNRIHVEDLAETTRLLLTNSDNDVPETLCLADDLPTKTSEVVDFYCKKFGFYYPKAISIEEAKERKMHSLVSNQRVSNKLLKKFLGKDLIYPSFKEGAESEEL